MARLLAAAVVLLAVIVGQLAWLGFRVQGSGFRDAEAFISLNPEPRPLNPEPRPLNPLERSEEEGRRLINRIEREINRTTNKNPVRVPVTITTPLAWQWLVEHFAIRGWQLRWEKSDDQWTAELTKCP